MSFKTVLALTATLASALTIQALAAQDCAEERGKIVVPIRRDYICQSGDLYWQSPDAQAEAGRIGFPDSEWKKNAEPGIRYQGTVRSNDEFTFKLSSECIKTQSGSISGSLHGLSAKFESTSTFVGENLNGSSHPVSGNRVSGTLREPVTFESVDFIFEEGYLPNVEIHADATLRDGYYRITLGSKQTIYLTCTQNR